MARGRRSPQDEYPDPDPYSSQPPGGQPHPGYRWHDLEEDTRGQDPSQLYYIDEDGLPIAITNADSHVYPPPSNLARNGFSVSARQDEPTYPSPDNIAGSIYPTVSREHAPPGFRRDDYPEPPEEEAREEQHPFVARLQQGSLRGFPVAVDDDYIGGYNEDDDFAQDFDSDGADFLPDEPDAVRAPRLRKVLHRQDADDKDYDQEDDEIQSSAGDDDEDDVTEDELGAEEEELPKGRRGGTRGRPRGRPPRGGRASRRGRRTIGQAVANIDKALGVQSTRGRRGRPRGRGRGRGRGRQRIADSENVLDDDGPRNFVGAKAGVRGALPPNPEFVRMQAEASNCFIEGNYEEAEAILQRALASNPEQYTAHSLLAEIYINTGDKEKAAMSFFLGAYSNHREQNAWKRTADLIVNRVGVDEPAAREFALHSYRQALALDRDDIALRKRRAWLLRESKYLRKAVMDYKEVLKVDPCDTYSLHLLAEMCVRKRWPTEALPFFKSALPDGHETQDNHECGALDWEHANLLADLHLRAGATPEGLTEVKRFARFLLGRKEEDFWDTIQDDSEYDADHESRRTDVMEFDPDKHPLDIYGNGLPIDMRMKLGIMRLRIGAEHLDEALHHFSWFPTEDVEDDYVLENTDVYIRIAGNLFATKHYEEAMLYYEKLRMVVIDLEKVHLERLAICYECCELLDEAEEVYLAIAESMTNDLAVVEKLVQLFERAGLEQRAEPYNERIIEDRRRKLRVPTDPKELSHMPPEPLSNANQDPEEDNEEPIDEREEEVDEEEDDDAIPLPEGDIPEIFQMQLKRLNLAEVEEGGDAGKKRKKRRWARRPYMDFDESQVQTIVQELDTHDQRTDLDQAVKNGRWLEIAGRLITIFKKQKVFYPANSHCRFWGFSHEAKQRSLLSQPDQQALWRANERKIQDGAPETEIWRVPTEFCSVSLDFWLDLFLQSALIFASQRKSREAYAMCDSALTASPFFHEHERVLSIRNIKLACAITMSDDETVSYIARDHIKEEQAVAGGAYRLFLAANLALPSPNQMWNSSINQKFMLRQIKAMDLNIAAASNVAPTTLTPSYKHPAQRPYNRVSTYTHDDGETGGEASEAEKQPKTELLMLYAHMLYAGGSHTEALNYLHRVHALRPDDPMLCLSMALSYVGWSFKRMSSNRHYLIIQGLTMFDKYKQERLKSVGEMGKENEDVEGLVLRQEVEFNMGRFWHTLGLLHLGVPCYERCIEIGEKLEQKGVQVDEVGFTVDAAFTLTNIWATNGQVEEAERLAEKWLVL